MTVAFVAVVGAFMFLSATGADSTEFWAFLNRLWNLLSVVLAGGSLAYAGQAAKQTNGGLDARIEEAARKALDKQRATDIEPGGELRREDAP